MSGREARPGAGGPALPTTRPDASRRWWRTLVPAGLVAVVGLVSGANLAMHAAAALLLDDAAWPAGVDLCGRPLQGLSLVWAQHSGEVLLGLAAGLTAAAIGVVVLAVTGLAVAGGRTALVAAVVVGLAVVVVAPTPWVLGARAEALPTSCLPS